MTHDHGLHLLAVANIGGAALHHIFENAQSIVAILVPLGQVSIAVVTVVYTIRKINLLKKHNKK